MYSWIKSGKVGGNEAAQLLAVLPRSARYPTIQYMNQFFVSIIIRLNEVKKAANISTVIFLFFLGTCKM